eukprot:GGOE01024642.1.p2 GENE.GGOE01024642.1~~GGOE01024642.1.p2  ORF type:complete len:117 (-),score=7.21 GGOE01024642.1:264-614(-)
MIFYHSIRMAGVSVWGLAPLAPCHTWIIYANINTNPDESLSMQKRNNICFLLQSILYHTTSPTCAAAGLYIFFWPQGFWPLSIWSQCPSCQYSYFTAVSVGEPMSPHIPLIGIIRC